MIDVREAVGEASRFARELYGDDLFDLRLEEVELSPDRKEWLITLGVRLKKRAPASLEAVRQIVGAPFEPDDREYKIFRVEAATGKVRSMKIRTVA